MQTSVQKNVSAQNRQRIRRVMDLKQFERINVFSLPVFEVSYPPVKWPSRFFLHNQHHVIFVEYSAPKKVATLYDSLGRSNFPFCKPFHALRIALRHFFRTRVLQSNPFSRVCAYHAVIFSLGFFCPDPEYKIRLLFTLLLRRVGDIIKSAGKNKFVAVENGLSTGALTLLPIRPRRPSA